MAVTLETFEKQIKYMSQHYNVLSLDMAIDMIRERTPIPRKSIVITFDDGFKDNYEYAYPILKKYNLPATFFLADGFISKRDIFWQQKINYIFQDKISLNVMSLLTMENCSSEARQIIRQICFSLNKNRVLTSFELIKKMLPSSGELGSKLF